MHAVGGSDVLIVPTKRANNAVTWTRSKAAEAEVTDGIAQAAGRDSIDGFKRRMRGQI